VALELYILDADGNPVPEPDLFKWAKWFSTADRNVAKANVGDAHISTIFLGLNHQWFRGPPLLWETMIFWPTRDDLNNECWRYASRADALVGHDAACALVRAALH
jgi:hypothetical protein